MAFSCIFRGCRFGTPRYSHNWKAEYLYRVRSSFLYEADPTRFYLVASLTVPREYCVSDSLRLLLKNRPSPLLSYPSSPYLPLRIPLIMPAFPLFSSCFSRSRDSLTMPDYYRTTRVEDYGPYLRTAQSSPDLYVCLFLYLKFVVLMPNFPDSLRC